MASTLLFLFSLLPLALAAPTATTTLVSSTTTTTCPTAGFPTDVTPYFSLRTNTFNNPDSPKNNLYLSTFHVEATLSVAVLLPESDLPAGPDLAYINGTDLQLAIQLGSTPANSIYWYLGFFDTAIDEIAEPMIVGVDGSSAATCGINDTTGLTYTSGFPTFVNWLACDMFGTAGAVQLIPQFAFYWEGGDVAGLGSDGVLPANCEAVHLLPQYAVC